MSFMVKEITDKQEWYAIDGPMGTDYVPIDICGEVDLSNWEDHTEVPTQLRDYTENKTAYDITRMTGYGARMSAPGYMDCTEWTVHETEESAEEYLDEYYGDDDEEEEGE